MTTYQCSVCGKRVKTEEVIIDRGGDWLRCMWLPGAMGSCHGELIPLISDNISCENININK